MLKDQDIIVEINKGNLAFYKKINSDIKIDDNLKIPISNLSKGSNLEVKATCEICNKEVFIKYKLYRLRYDKNGSFACCKKCAAKRTKHKLMSEYAVKNIAQLPSVKSKIKKTNIEKWGNVSHNI